MQRYKNLIKRLTNVGKTGFDDLGNAIKTSYERPVGTLARLIELQKIYKNSSVGMTNPDQIAKYNQKMEETALQINRVKNIGKAGFDELGNAIKVAYERPVGTLNRLIELQKIYKDGSASMTNPELIAKYNQKLEETTAAIARTKNAGRAGFDDLGNAIKRTTSYQETLTNRLKIYQDAIKAQPNTAAGAQNIVALNKKVEETTTELERMSRAGKKGFDELGNAIEKSGGFFGGLKDQVVGMVASYLTLYAAIAAIKSIVHSNAELSDSISDVKRTAKETTEEVGNLVSTLKETDTRTSLNGLLETGFIGGQLAVAKKDLVGYIETIDQLAVVLKREFPGGAEAVARSLGKIISIYKLTSKENISLEESLKKVGSAFLGIAHSGPVNVQYLQDFTLRTAGAAQVAKLSLPTMLAYGAVLSEAGVSAQIAASSTTRLVSSLSGKREKYFAIAQLADSTLTLEKFTKLVNTDSKTALDLFFKGLKSGNPTTTEFNDRLGTLGFKVGAATNAITALALNQEKLSDKVKIGNEQYEDAALLAENFTEKNNNLAASFDKLGNALTNISSNPDSGLGKTLKYLAEGAVILIKNIDTILSKIGPLASGLKNAFSDIFSGPAAGAKRQADALAAIAEEKRKSTIEANRDKIEGVATIKARVIVDKTTDQASFKKALEVEQKKLNRLYEQSNYAKEFAKNPKNSAADIEPFIRKFKSLQAPLLLQQTIVDRLKKSFNGLYGAVQETFDYGTGENRTVDEIKADIKALQGLMKPLDVNSKQYAEYLTKLKALKKELKVANGGIDNSGKQEADQYRSALKSRTDLQAKITELTKKGTDKQLSSDQQEIESVRDKYTKMRAEAAAFNNDPKNIAKGLRVDAGSLVQGEKKEIAAVVYKQDTSKFALELDRQKLLYADFEKAKTEIGETAAKLRYEKDIDTNKTYLNKLQEQYADIIYKGVNTVLTGKPLTGPEMERFKEGKKRIEEEIKVNKDGYNALLLDNETYEQTRQAKTETFNKRYAELAGEANAGRRAVLTKGYQDEMDQLSSAMLQKSDIYKKAAAQALELTREETIKQVAALDRILKSGVIPDSFVKKIQDEISRLKFSLNIGVNEGNLLALKDELTRVAAQLHVKDENGNEIILSKEDYNLIIQRLAEIQLKIDGITKPSGKAKSNFAKGLADNFKYLKGSASEVAAGVSKDLGALSGSFNELSSAMGGNDTQAGYFLDTLGQLSKAGSDAAGAFSSFASGDIIGGITKTVSAVTSVLSIGKKVKEMNAAARKEVEDFYANAISGEREYQDLLKERELQTIRNNKIVLQGIRDEVALRKQQNDAYVKEAAEIMAKLQGQSYVSAETYKHGTWFRKASVDKTYSSLQGMNFEQLSQLLAQGKLEGDAKSLVERLKELEQKGYDAEQAIADLAKETSELFTGTTSDNLTNTLAQMFAEGKTSAKDLADFFKQTMDEAALSIFKNKVLAGAMEKFYAEFDKAAQSGDELTSDEIATLNGLFTSLTGEALKKFQEFQKITGSDLTTGSTSGGATGVAGKVLGEALTEGTANRYLGIATSQYDEIKRQGIVAKSYYDAAINHFRVTVQIAANTLRTANNTDGITGKLDQIITNTKPVKETNIDQKLRDAAVK
jgi:TP901 family phage tail tape measure protein